MFCLAFINLNNKRNMNPMKIKDNSVEKEKTWSTSSFYQEPSFKLLNSPESSSPFIDEATVQQKVFEDSTHTFLSELAIQKERISKASS